MSYEYIGAARIVFGADSSEFDRTVTGVRGTLQSVVGLLEGLQRRIRNLGATMTVGITVPLGLTARAVDKTAGAFEGQMKRVEAALDSVTGEQLKQLSDQARSLGPAVGKGATEAAEGIEELGLAGLSTADILGGGLKATLNLAAAGMVEVAPAAGLVTDVMGQFKATAEDLPRVVGQVTGSLDASKFEFQDFADAVAQGGGVAASAGVSFLDFSTAVAATSTQFSSGSDAGTSFKTYIQSLVGNSNEAKAAMKQLGIEFFDTATGRMKPLAEQAEILRKALGNLDDASKTEALKTIFGADAARTAIGLMEQGRVGFERLQATVAGGDVEAKIAKRLEGSAAAGVRIANAWESVKIAIGETGLLDIMTAIKNGFAAMLEAFAGAPKGVHVVAAAFAAVAAAVGPLIMGLASLGSIIFARLVSGFGIIGRAVALFISPISTLIGMIGEMGLVRVLTMVGSRLLGLAGPIGWAIGAILLFRNNILQALSIIWNGMVTTLGPPLEALVAKVQAIFERLSGGPIGSAIGGLIGLLGQLKDFVGTGLTATFVVVGEVITRAIGAVIAIVSGLVDVVAGVVEVISRLLTGDFAGAWEAAVGIVEAVFGAIVDAVAAIIPELGAELQAIYALAKMWLSDAMGAVLDYMGERFRGAITFVSNILPIIGQAAQNAYTVAKAWLVDKFGWLLDWVGKAAKFIGDTWGALQKKLGMGGGPAVPEPKATPAPKEPAAPAAPKRHVSFGDEDKAKKKREPKGRSTQYDGANRAQLALDAELEAARVRGDLDRVRAIEDRLALSKQVEAYQRTGLDLAKATAAAERDMGLVRAARAEAIGRELADQQRGHEIEIAGLDENRQLEETLTRQKDLRAAIHGFQRDGLDLAAATARATQQQLDLDAARGRVRARWLADDAQARAIDLARARGATEEEVRELQRVVDIRDRARDLAAQGGLSDADALSRATAEWEQDDKARVQGLFRSTFRDGIRSALDGDLSGFVKDWWKQRVAKGMEEAINSLADLVQRLFANLKIGGSGGGSGNLTGIAGLFGKMGGLFSSRTSNPFGIDWSAGSDRIPIPLDPIKLPGFATGGSFKIGGRSGIDQNLVAFRGTLGETVHVTKGDNDAGPTQRVEIVPSPWFDARAASAAEPSIQSMGARAAEGGSRLAAANASRNRRRTITR